LLILLNTLIITPYIYIVTLKESASQPYGRCSQARTRKRLKRNCQCGSVGLINNEKKGQSFNRGLTFFCSF
jgi:hypothetical protein